MYFTFNLLIYSTSLLHYLMLKLVMIILLFLLIYHTQLKFNSYYFQYRITLLQYFQIHLISMVILMLDQIIYPIFLIILHLNKNKILGINFFSFLDILIMIFNTFLICHIIYSNFLLIFHLQLLLSILDLIQLNSLQQHIIYLQFKIFWLHYIIIYLYLMN